MVVAIRDADKCLKPTETVTDDEFDKVFNVNVKSIYYSAQVIVPVMQKYGNGGSFVNIASTAGIRPRPGLVWYNASKAAVINASKAMAVEYAKDKIRFNSICPVVGLGTGLYVAFLPMIDGTIADCGLTGRTCSSASQRTRRHSWPLYRWDAAATQKTSAMPLHSWQAKSRPS